MPLQQRSGFHLSLGSDRPTAVSSAVSSAVDGVHEGGLRQGNTNSARDMAPRCARPGGSVASSKNLAKVGWAAAVRKRKVLVLNGRFRPKRSKNGLYQSHTARTGAGNSTSVALRRPGSLFRPPAHLLAKLHFSPFCLIWGLSLGVQGGQG